MDIKVSGLTREIMAQALQQANDARQYILNRMLEVCRQPRTEMSRYAPRITRIQINPEKIGTVIGPGGKQIKKIIEETKVSIDIEDDGSVLIASSDAAATKRAIEIVRSLTEEVEVGRIYHGTVRRLMDFGAFVEVLPGKEGLVHISQLATHQVERVSDVVNVGDPLDVKVTGIDSLGRINLSHRAVIDPNWTGDNGGDRRLAARPSRGLAVFRRRERREWLAADLGEAVARRRSTPSGGYSPTDGLRRMATGEDRESATVRHPPLRAVGPQKRPHSEQS